MSSLVTCSSSLLSVEGDGRLPNPSLKAESYLCHWLMAFIKASTQHTVSYHWKCFLYYTFYYYPIWGALPRFHRDHPRLLVTELGWGELQFFSFTVYNILGCHGGFKAVAVWSTEVTWLDHESKSSLYKMEIIVEFLGWKEHWTTPLLCGRVRKPGLFLTDVCIIFS